MVGSLGRSSLGLVSGGEVARCLVLSWDSTLDPPGAMKQGSGVALVFFDGS